MRRQEAQGPNRADVERDEIGDIVLIEALGILSQDHIPIACHRRASHSRTIAPQGLFLFFLLHGLLVRFWLGSLGRLGGAALLGLGRLLILGSGTGCSWLARSFLGFAFVATLLD